MKRLAILEDRKKEIIGEIRRSDESKYDHRPHGVLLVANGLSPYRVSEVMGDSPKSVENWVNSFLKDGFGSLREPRRPGRPTRLSDIMDSISLDLRKNPMDLGYSQNLWDGKLLSHHLSLRYSVYLGTRQCQRIFRKLGFRLRKPRQKIAKGDSSHKEKLKKTPVPCEGWKIHCLHRRVQPEYGALGPHDINGRGFRVTGGAGSH